MGKVGPKGQEKKPSFDFVGQEAPYYSVLNGQEEKNEGHLMEAMSPLSAGLRLPGWVVTLWSVTILDFLQMVPKGGILLHCRVHLSA